MASADQRSNSPLDPVHVANQNNISGGVVGGQKYIKAEVIK